MCCTAGSQEAASGAHVWLVGEGPGGAILRSWTPTVAVWRHIAHLFEIVQEVKKDYEFKMFTSAQAWAALSLWVSFQSPEPTKWLLCRLLYAQSLCLIGTSSRRYAIAGDSHAHALWCSCCGVLQLLWCTAGNDFLLRCLYVVIVVFSSPLLPSHYLQTNWPQILNYCFLSRDSFLYYNYKWNSNNNNSNYYYYNYCY